MDKEKVVKYLKRIRDSWEDALFDNFCGEMEETDFEYIRGVYQGTMQFLVLVFEPEVRKELLALLDNANITPSC